jgi:hypothetical protein
MYRRKQCASNLTNGNSILVCLQRSLTFTTTFKFESSHSLVTSLLTARPTLQARKQSSNSSNSILSTLPTSTLTSTTSPHLQWNSAMRKIEKQMLRAIHHGNNWRLDNTEVIHSDLTIQVRLHGHLIAWIGHKSRTLTIDSCGWQTNTTKSRLNVILNEFASRYYISQRNFEWFLNDRVAHTSKSFESPTVLDLIVGNMFRS